jgi:N-acetylmuramoyl-L-alanine amidase
MRHLAFGICLLLGFGRGISAEPLTELAPDRPAPRLERVSFSGSDNEYARLVRLHLNGRVIAFSDPMTTADGRTEVWLYNVKRSSDFVGEDSKDPVRDYRTAVSRGHLVVSLDISGSVLSDVYRDTRSNDLLIALSPTGPDAMPSAVSVMPAAAGTQGAAHADGDIPGNTPLENSVSEAAARWRFDRVVIDAGHGGKDPGATAPGRIREKDLVLPIALKLGQYLEERLGVEVIYTRDDDTFISLRNRGRIANANDADLFISIHANSAANRRASGTETFYLGMNKESSAQRVIERENSVIQQFEQDQEAYEQFDQAALVRRQLAQSAFLRKSEELATRIEHDFSERIGRKSRGVKEGNLQVLWAAAMPAVLVEVGFLSNPAEARFLRSQDGIAYMASGIFRAVKDYKSDYEGSLSLSADD